jgi:hypothetical protein
LKLPRPGFRPQLRGLETIFWTPKTLIIRLRQRWLSAICWLMGLCWVSLLCKEIFPWAIVRQQLDSSGLQIGWNTHGGFGDGALAFVLGRWRDGVEEIIIAVKEWQEGGVRAHERLRVDAVIVPDGQLAIHCCGQAVAIHPLCFLALGEFELGVVLVTAIVFGVVHRKLAAGLHADKTGIGRD